MGLAWAAFCAFLATFAAAGTNEEGLKFLEASKTWEGVVTLKSGLQYKVLKAGSGKYHPKKDSSCECHYAGTTPALTPNAVDLPEAEWKEFDSSYKRGSPTSFAPNQVIKGWTEAMQKMVEGDKWEMYIPSELGYGDSGSGDKIKGGDVLIFRMELLKILGGKKRAAKCDLKTKENCEPDEVQVLEEWAAKPLEEIDAEVKRIEKWFEGTLKAGEREKKQGTLSMLKKIFKAKKKMEL
mmetsp:Transcript_60308/g.166929  ORF Transcript_60308/g.166929 Transcript_60308/m.166929 type:complete len:238 (-) Transcript_60308:78-791(-)|eukprot:CAMPEP_0179100942 /NCGR_PEP_ID=MMETSP0796-20121207/46644_1 /TAXON_ID=73915 /ORGANISM="Pyrodinium bahamense, Strain pbaha01" /LENGTH=237 /DNA_ID=CAMNT_0020798777 /DNA_START=68 /DNA_END=781 /DNA_ORIENTATION=-